MRAKKVFAAVLAGVLIAGYLPDMGTGGETGEAKAAEKSAVPAYLDTSLGFEERAADLVSRMTLDEKALQTITTNAAAIPRLGVSEYNYWSEGLHGVARSGRATSFPHGLGIASTWNADLVYEMGDAISDEARGYANGTGKGLSYWSPTINLARDPRWGRAEEGYGEDPYLTTVIGENYVNGMQGEDDTYLKTIATLKHFLANNSEYNRHTGSSDVDDRDLREYYSYTFKNIVENTDVASVMSSYNQLNGTPMPANKFMLTDLLRNTWGFDGYVTSDCGAIADIYQNHKWQPEGMDRPVNSVEATAAAITAGTDINCGSVYHVNVKQAIEQGLMTEDDLDRALIRLFTARMKTGEFDPDEMVEYKSDKYSFDSQVENEEHKQLAEDMSDEAIVLLQNEDDFLPLGSEEKNIVIVGEMAQRCTQGDYSADPSDENCSTPVEGITAAAQRAGSDIKVDYINHYGVTDASGVKYLLNVQGFEFGYGDGSTISKTAAQADGYEACVVETNANQNFGYMNSGAYALYKDVDVTDLKTFCVQAAGADNESYSSTAKLHLDSPNGEVIAAVDADYTSGWQDYAAYTGEVSSDAAGVHDLYITFEFNYSDVSFSAEEEALIRNADAVIVVAGTRTIDGEGALGNPDSDSAEEVDRETLDFPRNQAGSILKCAQLNENTVVCISAVGQMNVEPFKNEVKAITWNTYNGQAQGNALGRILYGEKNPSAKLTFTWYTSIYDLDDIGVYSIRSDETSNGRTYQYFTGEVTWPFGYGLSYTDFKYSNLKIDKDTVTTNDQIQVSVDVTNTGSRDGQEVVEMYVASPDAEKKDRPVKRLKGFDKVDLAAGETKTVTMTLNTDELEYWSENENRFDYDLGTYEIQIGPASDTVALSATFSMTEKADPTLKTVTLTGKAVFDETEIGEPAETTLTAALNDDSFIDITDVVYTSSNESVARVDENGNVTAVGYGTATITAAVTWNGETVTGSYAVAVQETAGKDLYYITSRDGSVVIAVNGGSTESGAVLIEWENNGGTDQQWSLEDPGDGYYYLVNSKSGLLATAENTDENSRLIQKEQTEGDTNQLWQLEESNEDGYYLIINAETGYAISRGPSEWINGWELNPFVMAEKNADDDNQLWSLEALITQYTIQASAGEGGSISPDGRSTVVENGNIVYTITADPGYQIKDVLVNGESVGAVSEYTFKDVNADAAIEAVFEASSEPAEPVLDRIELTGPDKTEYKQGEELDLKGLTVTAVYTDGTSETRENVPVNDCRISGYDPDKPGEQTIAVWYGEKSETFTVNVVETEDPDNPGTEDPDNPGTEDPDNPGTEDPDNPGTENPDNPGTEDPDNPGTEDPDNPGTEDPDNPGTEDPDNPGTEDPDKPDSTSDKQDTAGEDKADSPQTGDNFSTAGVAALLAISAAGICIGMNFRRRQK